VFYRISVSHYLGKLDAATEYVELTSTSQRVRLTGMCKPDWAAAIRRDREGISAALRVNEHKLSWLRWQEPKAGNDGHWLALGSVAGWDSPGPIREDGFGLYAEFRVKGVVQRCRWISPGGFSMGSPKGEEGRWDDEGPQHEVTLSGYWLADTACTQALWQAVMGDNPSDFKDDENNPVDSVSWDDCRKFFAKLNEWVPGLAAGFSTEAQWEHACRAGTATAYSFGQKVSQKQANFGNERKKTVLVASLPPNPWGLFEMHGNVLEWCSDWFGSYAAEPQADPEGSSQGEYRVLRGGSWFSFAQFARSAYRYHFVPGYCIHFVGLRVAPGRAGPAEPAAGKEEAAGRPRGTRAGPAAESQEGRLGKIMRKLKKAGK
jgi:formylglycine-generating enzyme required for sulfatase activity